VCTVHCFLSPDKPTWLDPPKIVSVVAVNLNGLA
jgi:hypothetical protein